MRSAIVLSLILVIFYCSSSSHAYPDGAPKGACAEMAPKHGDNVPQVNGSPFKVTATSDAGGSMIQVMISSTTEDKFKGFLITARAPDEVGVNGGKNLGQFFAGDDGMSQTLTCNSTADAITHTNNDEKTSVMFKWSPADYSGSVIFAGAVVQETAKFYTGVKSASIQATAARR